MLEYESILSGLKLEKLAQMGVVMKYTFKLDIMDRIRSRNRKEHAVVTIFNDNKTSDTGVIHCYNRTFSRRGMCYLVMNERGIYDPEFQMTHFYYYANQSCPILFQKGKLPENAYDAKLIDATIEMKVIEALAAIDIEKWIKIILVCVILSLVMNLLNIAKGLKGSGIPIIGG
jgi:hypothetical protein